MIGKIPSGDTKTGALQSGKPSSRVFVTFGPNISTTTAIASFLLVVDAPLGLGLGVVVCLLAGGTVGLLNGVFVRYLHLPDLIATLASFSIITGIALTICPAPGGMVHFGFADLILISLLGIPLVFLVAVALVMLTELILIK